MLQVTARTQEWEWTRHFTEWFKTVTRWAGLSFLQSRCRSTFVKMSISHIQVKNIWHVLFFYCGPNDILGVVFFLFYRPLCWDLYLLLTHPPLQICNEKLSHLGRYDIMLSCWSHDPLKRPSFRKLVEQTELLLSENTKNVSKCTTKSFFHEWSRIPERVVTVSSTLFLRFTWDWATTRVIRDSRGRCRVDSAQSAARQLRPSLYCKAQLTSFWTTSETC